ncbi:MAG: hypothetical protein J6Z00_00825, partial [Clostridia bacterium]|nr:hypothetical protein [Clostridia bacterium]
MERRRILAIFLMALLVLAVSISASALNQSGYRGGEIVLLSESDACAPKLVGYREGWEFKNLQKSTWEEGGVHGKAMRLNGKTDYLEYEDFNVFCRPVTIAGWINWRGSLNEEDDGTGEINQHVFTILRDQENYVTVNLRAVFNDYKKLENGTSYRIDGIYMEYSLSGSTGKHVDAYNLTTGEVNYVIPKNQWVHFALVMNDVNLELYINGAKWFSKALPGGAEQLKATKLWIGRGVKDDDPTLNASIDDIALFAESLPVDYIQALANGTDLQFLDETEKTNYIPTQVTEPTTTAKSVFGIQISQDGKIPWFTWYVIPAIVFIFFVLFLIVNLKPEKKGQKVAAQKEPADMPSAKPEAPKPGVAAQKAPTSMPKPVAPVTVMPAAPRQPVTPPTSVRPVQPAAPVSKPPVPAVPVTPKPAVPVAPTTPVPPVKPAAPIKGVPVPTRPATTQPVAQTKPAVSRPASQPIAKPVQAPIRPVATQPATQPRPTMPNRVAPTRPATLEQPTATTQPVAPARPV